MHVIPPRWYGFPGRGDYFEQEGGFCLDYVDFCKYYTLFNFLAMMRQRSFFFYGQVQENMEKYFND